MIASIVYFSWMLVVLIQAALASEVEERRPAPQPCNGLASLKGVWALSWSGVSLDGKQTNGIGSVTIGSAGRIKNGWVMRKLDNDLAYVNVTGNFTMNEKCTSILSISQADGFEFAFHGTIDRANRFMRAFSKVEGVAVLGEVSRVTVDCARRTSLMGVWSGATHIIEDGVFFQSTSSVTLDCRNTQNQRCNVYYVGNPVPVNVEAFKTNTTFHRASPCGYFTFDGLYEGHRAVAFGNGVYAISDRNGVHATTQFYKGRI